MTPTLSPNQPTQGAEMPEATTTRFNYWFVPFTGMSSIAEMKHGGDTVRCLSYDVKPTGVQLARLANLGLLLTAPPTWDRS